MQDELVNIPRSTALLWFHFHWYCKNIHEREKNLLRRLKLFSSVRIYLLFSLIQGQTCRNKITKGIKKLSKTCFLGKLIRKFVLWLFQGIRAFASVTDEDSVFITASPWSGEGVAFRAPFFLALESRGHRRGTCRPSYQVSFLFFPPFTSGLRSSAAQVLIRRRGAATGLLLREAHCTTRRPLK